ncbi:MAG: septum formation protein Maf [Mogibacterium sp.]|nr:septum formation protein Maf [Mogibacterium sp.]
MKIILASASPRRLEIMNKHGIDPIVIPTDTDETLSGNPSMTEAVEDLSHRKALACYEIIKSDRELSKQYAGHIIIGADTIVYTDRILGKPEDADDARHMLESYRGTFHYVLTGISLIDSDSGKSEVMSDVTKVWCINYSDEDIEDYINREEPYDKAGAYAIQGYFGRYIDHIEGDYENVMGLPFYRIEDILKSYK